MYTQIWDAMTNAASDRRIRRNEDGAIIPFDDRNRDYREYKAWLAEGNEPNPPGSPAPPTEGPPPLDIHEVNAQVQDIDARLSVLETSMGR